MQPHAPACPGYKNNLLGRGAATCQQGVVSRAIGTGDDSCVFQWQAVLDRQNHLLIHQNVFGVAAVEVFAKKLRPVRRAQCSITLIAVHAITTGLVDHGDYSLTNAQIRDTFSQLGYPPAHLVTKGDRKGDRWKSSAAGQQIMPADAAIGDADKHLARPRLRAA